MSKTIWAILILVVLGGAVYYFYQPNNQPPAVQPLVATTGEVKVDIKNFAFNPAVVMVKKGTKITWTNGDSAPHTITSSDGVLNSPHLSTGDSFSFTPTAAGTIEYHCAIHPAMVGKVVVTE